LLSDQLYLALDFIPSASPAAFDVHAEPLEIPTVPGDIQQLQTRVMSILAKLDALPLAKIGGDADSSLRSLNDVLTQVDRELLPSARGTMTSAQGTLDSLQQILTEDSPSRLRLQSTLEQAELTLRSVRSLADYLDRHPEALLRGRSGQSAVSAVPP
jgi:paraquat-inducible protein B